MDKQQTARETLQRLVKLATMPEDERLMKVGSLEEWAEEVAEAGLAAQTALDETFTQSPPQS